MSMKPVSSDHQQPPIAHVNDPRTGGLLHQLLVTSAALQRIPAPVVAVILLILSGLVGLAWQHQPLIALAYLLAALLNWWLLWQLPRTGRSYGLERPSALALAVLMALVLLPLGVLQASWGVGGGVLAVITFTAFYTTYVEPFNLRVTQQTYTTPKWNLQAHPLRLLHIGDLHLERITPRERRLNLLVRELKPDVIVFSGDFVNLSYTYDPQTAAGIRTIVGEWDAPLGVYAVPGTPEVEPLTRVQQLVAGLGNIRLLLNEWITVQASGGQLHIAGMITTHELERDQQTVYRLAQHMPAQGLTLLLTHAPDVAPEADVTGFDLYLCGHTHGGQLRLPLIGALFSASHLGMRFVMGRYQLPHTTVYTSRGVGLEGLGAPRARLLCPPELILWTIRGES